MKEKHFIALLAAVIVLCTALTLALALYTVELRKNVSILSYIATEGL